MSGSTAPVPTLRLSARERVQRCKFVVRAVLNVLRHPSELKDTVEWVSGLVRKRTPLADSQPLLPFHSTRWLDVFVGPKDEVFEYGSGGSTLFLAQRAKSVVSVEHDPRWYKRTLEELRSHGLHNCCLILRGPSAEPRGTAYDASEPTAYWASGSERLWLESYVRVIDRYPDHHFSLVLIDGKARPACILHAIPKVKGGGVMVLDDVTRTSYHKAVSLLVDWKRIDLSGLAPYKFNFGATVAWQKPSDTFRKNPMPTCNNDT